MSRIRHDLSIVFDSVTHHSDTGTVTRTPDGHARTRCDCGLDSGVIPISEAHAIHDQHQRRILDETPPETDRLQPMNDVWRAFIRGASLCRHRRHPRTASYSLLGAPVWRCSRCATPLERRDTQ